MSVPEEVALARGVAALRTAMLLLLGTALGLGVIAGALLLLAADPDDVLPGITTLMIGQFTALATGGLTFAALHRVLLPGADPGAIRTRTARRLRGAGRPLLVALIAATVGWVLVEPLAGLGALVGALVGAQAILPVTVAARTLETPLS